MSFLVLGERTLWGNVHCIWSIFFSFKHGVTTTNYLLLNKYGSVFKSQLLKIYNKALLEQVIHTFSKLVNKKIVDMVRKDNHTIFRIRTHQTVAKNW